MADRAPRMCLAKGCTRKAQTRKPFCEQHGELWSGGKSAGSARSHCTGDLFEVQCSDCGQTLAQIRSDTLRVGVGTLAAITKKIEAEHRFCWRIPKFGGRTVRELRKNRKPSSQKS